MSDQTLFIVIGIVALFIFSRIRNSKLADKKIQQGEEFLAENARKEGVVSTESGLQYEVLTKGEGTVHPTENSKVKVRYHGTLTDGTVFDSSVDRGKPISFPLNKVSR